MASLMLPPIIIMKQYLKTLEIITIYCVSLFSNPPSLLSLRKIVHKREYYIFSSHVYLIISTISKQSNLQ